LIRRRKISNLRYVDDILIVATSAEKMEDIMNKLRLISEAHSLALKVMIIDRTCRTSEARYEVVNKFVYLESLITNDGECEKKYAKDLVWRGLPLLSWEEYRRTLTRS